ncbi:MAG TPA: LytR C-terminal domain-containing protein [Gemmatimonadaceae bacterium]|nr:LytR C-terminal domain-containing protein [Gemmatimonadaceae bacterium]
MERRRLIRRAAVVVALALVVVGIVLAVRSPSTRAPQAVRQRVDAEAPPGVRIRVEVLNATRVRGLARRATMHLRDRGFDVVNVGTSRETRDTTVVLDRSGHADWAALVARALGGARVEQAPDSSRYLDVTVLVGATWRPPAEPFYP